METVYDSLCTSISQLCAQYTGACIRPLTFGTSYLGRSIPAIQLGEGSHRLLYLGGITGDIRSSALLLRFVRDYAQAQKSGMRVAGIDISYLRHTRTITVVPLLNVDGAVLRCDGRDDNNPLTDRLRSMLPVRETDPCAENDFSDWICSGRGVDLRCNYDFEFASAMAEAHGIGGAGFPGMHPESEPECAAVAGYLRGAASTDLVLSFCEDTDGSAPDGSISYSGTEHRTRALASILSRDIDGRGYECTSRSAGGSLGDWYRTLHAGPLLNITLPADTHGTADTQEPLYSHEHLHALLTDHCSAPGDTLAHASLTLLYGKLRKMLFHGAVL